MSTVGPPPKQPQQLAAQNRRTGEASRPAGAAADEGFWVPLDDAEPAKPDPVVEPSQNGADADGLASRFKLRSDALFTKIRSGASFEEIVEEFPEVPGWTVSLVVHVLVLAVLSLFHMKAGADPTQFEIVTEVTEIPEKLNVVELTSELDPEKVAAKAQVSPMAGASKAVETTALDTQSMREPVKDLVADATPDGSKADDEGAFNNISLIEEVDLPGQIVNTASDEGSIDRITIEILNRLKKHKVLVVWLMDASGSLRTRREEVIKRFDRIYHELNEKGGIQDDALQTAVVAFGEKSVPMLKEPTANSAEIQKAVQAIPTDESGVENVFNAVGAAALHYRKFLTGGREAILIVLTDEIGDDLVNLDTAIKAVKREKMPVFVLGPTAPFGVRKMRMKWTDEATKEVFYLPVDRGPETVIVEHAKLPSWNRGAEFGLLSSGFGPYGLSRLVRESSGIYFLYDDGTIPGPKFDIQDMMAVVPDYVSQSDYQRLAMKSPLRSGVLKVVEATQSKVPNLSTEYLAAGIQFEIRKNADTMGQVVRFLNQAIDELRSAESFRGKEASKRWHAHYDLLLGRMLVTRIRCYRSVPLLEEMFKKPKVPKSATANAWELAGIESTSLTNLAPTAEPDDAKKPPAKKGSTSGDDPTAADVPLARKYLERVVREHPHTPWALMAQSELDFPLSFAWKEAFIEPPLGGKLPWDKVPWDKLSDEQKKFVKKVEKAREQRKKKAAKRKEAEKRKPKNL